MKKFLILLLSITLFTACSDDDDATSVEGDIVGTWFLVDTRNVPGFNDIDECTGQSTITFNEDNTAFSEFFSNEDGECVSDSESGNWSKSSDSQYTINVPGFGELPGNVEFNGDRFTFSPIPVPGASLTFERQ